MVGTVQLERVASLAYYWTLSAATIDSLYVLTASVFGQVVEPSM